MAAKIAGYFINKLPRKDIEIILLSWDERNTPPLQCGEIQQVIDSIYRYKQSKKREANNEKNLRGYFS